MTTVTFLRKGGLFVGVTAEGHADYAEHGSDIVCAAVSSGQCSGLCRRRG